MEVEEARLQSAVEFLTTYSFALIVIAVAIAMVFAITATTRTEIKSQCVSFGSVSCDFVNYYSPKALKYSLLTLSITNTQESAMQVNSMSITIGPTSYNGICSPDFMLPGQGATCIANISSSSGPNLARSGFFTINAMFCNLPLSAGSDCNEPTTYRGSFYTYTIRTPAPIFSAIAAVGNSSVQLPAYNSVPRLPPSYASVNNGDWVGQQSSTAIAYALGTTSYLGRSYLGVGVAAFPSTLYYLNYNAISCTPGYNTTLSFAYTAIYLNAATAVTFNAYADNAIAVWYKQEGSGTWNSVYGSTYWTPSAFGPATNTVSLARGMYSIAVEWANTCGQGLQAFNVSGSNI